MNNQDKEFSHMMDVGVEVLEELDTEIGCKQKTRRNMERKLKWLITQYDDYPDSFWDEEYTTDQMRMLVNETKRKMERIRDE